MTELFKFRFDRSSSPSSTNQRMNNLLNSSNSMDVDDDDDNFEKNNNVNANNCSFISNISVIHGSAYNENDEHSNSWTNNQGTKQIVANESNHNVAISTTAKKTRTLRKKQNRFISDSDSESDNDENNVFSKRNTFNYMAS